jgi:CheY-like chemotaxis protein
MSDQILAAVYLAIAIVLSSFIVYRLRLNENPGREGRGYIYAGTVLIVAGAAINLIQGFPGYSRWFLPAVYGPVNVAEFLILGGGFVFAAVGLALYFNYWGEQQRELAGYISRLRLLESLQQESRFPFPMTELLDRTLKNLLAGLDEEAGAIFLLNRSQRQFVLATAAGLTKEEVALLEYYPYGRNIISQAVEEENSLLSSDFRNLGGKAQLAASRFRSILVIPLISGKNKLGSLILFSQEEKHYTRETISLISPLADWLSEKIEAARLGKELSKTSRELESIGKRHEDFVGKIERIIKCARGAASPSSFAEKCVGLAGATEIWLVGLINGRLHIYGGTGETPDFSENFRSALINAIPKSKPLILNQEGTDDKGESVILRASVLLPVDDRENAIIFRNNGGPFALSEQDLKSLETAAAIAGLVINNAISGRIANARNRGFESISAVLKMKILPEHFNKEIKNIIEIFNGLTTPDSIIFCFERYKASLRFFCGNLPESNAEVLSDIEISFGEGAAGRSAAMKQSEAIFGAAEVAENLDEYEEENRNAFLKIIGDREKPVFHAAYPLIIDGQISYVITVFGFGASADDLLESHRLTTVLVALVNLKLEMATIAKASRSGMTLTSADKSIRADMNSLNNDLTAISGYCQLALRDPNLSGEQSRAFEAILEIVEKMAANLKTTSPQIAPVGAISVGTDLNELIMAKFGGSRISGNLYMVGQRPLEVSLKLKEIPRLGISPAELNMLIDSVCDHFAEGMTDEELITVGSYSQRGFVYLDISRHRKNFPPVEPVAGFGRYFTPNALEGELRKADFIGKLALLGGEFAYDKFSKYPSYYSFKFPVAATADLSGVANEEPPTILAIDDQAVILDLLAAMAQSLGYKALTARNGRDGLALFDAHRPDIVLADLAMPEMSGIEVAARIKAISPGTPVALVTGWGASVDEEKLKKAGIDFVLNKPFRLEQLSELVAKIRAVAAK